MSDKAWSIRRTEERDLLVEQLRQKLAASGRPVETIHGVVTTTAIIDEALKELDKALEKEAPKTKQ